MATTDYHPSNARNTSATPSATSSLVWVVLAAVALAAIIFAIVTYTGPENPTATSQMATPDTAPVITACAPNQGAFANASCQAPVPDFTSSVVASDCNGPLSITQVPSVGTQVGLGVTVVTISVKDAANNETTCQANFTVNDNINPVITTCAPRPNASTIGTEPM